MTVLHIGPTLALPMTEISISGIRAQGAGGQNVNKVSSAVHLRFDIRASSLPEELKEKLLSRHDSRITGDGCIVIKAQQYRSLEKNKADGLERLAAIIRQATVTQKKRKPTRPGKAARARRLDAKSRRAKTKEMRKKVQ